MKRTTRKGSKVLHNLKFGPWSGHSIALASDGDGCTALLMIGGDVGRYRKGYWEAFKAEVEVM